MLYMGKNMLLVLTLIDINVKILEKKFHFKGEKIYKFYYLRKIVKRSKDIAIKKFQREIKIKKSAR
jgi:hypothetical protein